MHRVRVHRLWHRKPYHLTLVRRFSPTNTPLGTSAASTLPGERRLQWLPALGEPLYWYQCGPTVYDDAHLGHARTYVTFDMVRRVIREWYQCLPITAMSVTDVDDKIIERARQQRLPNESIGQTCSRIAAIFEKRFFEDLDLLGVLRPLHILRVSEHIPVICAFTTRLLDTEYAYVTTSGDVCFDTSRVQSRYGVLDASRALDASHAGTATETAANTPAADNVPGKRHPADFALWKAVSATDEEPGWPFYVPDGANDDQKRIGYGRPGWHIECSAMCAHVFGTHLDLHSGGMDLRFPHHENELHLSECYHRVRPWCRKWMHTGTLLIRGEKMAKSRGNSRRIRDYLGWSEQGPNDLMRIRREADVFRMFCAMHRHSTPVEFGDTQRLQAARIWDRLTGWLARIANDARSQSRKESSRARSVAGQESIATADASIEGDIPSTHWQPSFAVASGEHVADVDAVPDVFSSSHTQAAIPRNPTGRKVPAQLAEWSQRCHRALAEAFADDLDFPRAVRALVEFTNQLYRFESGRRLDRMDAVEHNAVLVASEYLASILRLLGFQSIPGVSSANAQASASRVPTAFIAALVDFRMRIRNLAKQLQQDTAQPTQKATEALYGLSDMLRDDILFRLGAIHIEDRKDNASRWWIDPVRADDNDR
jgi:cysteinyl-tRNA synthetase